MPPIVPLVLWTSTLLAASNLLAITTNSTTQGTSAKHKVYNACTIISNGTYHSDPVANNTSAEWHLFNHCHLYHMNLHTSVSGTALKDNRCCRVCCRVTVSLGRYATYYLMDRKAPFGFPCGTNKICDEKQLCLPNPNGTIKINKTIEPDPHNFVGHIEWVSGPSNDYTHE
uniref:Putative ixostatin n=1 Tax=Ixodes ricinus TaxID=34613 RepID=A0A0K8RH69_IXORI